MSRPPVYLDYHATTPVDRRVLDRMLPYFTETFGNPASSTHQWGWKAQEAVEQARREVSQLIGASPREIYFTSGATESNNLAMQGACGLADAGRRHMVVSAIEHKSVLEAAERMERRGWRCTVVPVDREGIIELEAVERAVADLVRDEVVVGRRAINDRELLNVGNRHRDLLRRSFDPTVPVQGRAAA